MDYDEDRCELMMNSTQLSLPLRMPWNGWSPRYLTRGHLLRTLANEGASRSIQDEHVEQLELFPKGTSYGA